MKYANNRKKPVKFTGLISFWMNILPAIIEIINKQSAVNAIRHSLIIAHCWIISKIFIKIIQSRLISSWYKKQNKFIKNKKSSNRKNKRDRLSWREERLRNKKIWFKIKKIKHKIWLILFLGRFNKLENKVKIKIIWNKMKLVYLDKKLFN